MTKCPLWAIMGNQWQCMIYHMQAKKVKIQKNLLDIEVYSNNSLLTFLCYNLRIWEDFSAYSPLKNSLGLMPNAYQPQWTQFVQNFFSLLYLVYGIYLVYFL